MNVVVVVPTYNERGNIAPLIPAIFEQLRSAGCAPQVLVVDDNSPDGTANVVMQMQSHFPDLHLLSGEKHGLGAAYIRGFRNVLATMNADVIVQMDADHSHKPEDLPRLLSAIEAGADFAIGSRYVSGGSIPSEWAFHRKLNSLFGNLAARYIAGLHRVRDCTAGFRAIRVSLLRTIDLDALRVQGYAFQVALLHAAVARGARVMEIPVDFIDRSVGTSKLGLRDIVEFVWNVWWIRFYSSRVFIKFAIVGASGVVVNLLILTLLLHAGVNKYLASPIAIEASIISNFLLNNYWTFRWREKTGVLPVRGLRFNIVSLLALLVSYTIFVALSIARPDGSPQLHQLAGIIPAMLVNYFLNTYWTFGAPPKVTSAPPASRRSSDTIR
ncbi:MAG TPA: glycosyltransferase family 2 protein [Burkholderiales bacterium]|nr:glycosyltransferase family 2 protein [Burkholderiales bacterium]